ARRRPPPRGRPTAADRTDGRGSPATRAATQRRAARRATRASSSPSPARPSLSTGRHRAQHRLLVGELPGLLLRPELASVDAHLEHAPARGLERQDLDLLL